MDSWYQGMLALTASAFSNANRQYAINKLPDVTARRYARYDSEYSPSVDRTAAASSPMFIRSAWRLPTTMKSDPNAAMMKNQSEILTPAAVAPPVKRNTNPDASATMSTTATCFRYIEYIVVIAT